MRVKPSSQEEVSALVDLSKRSFDTDVLVGRNEPGGPPDYDSQAWHLKMQGNSNLFAIKHEGRLVGGALLFPDKKYPDTMLLGRVFIDPDLHGQGYGLQAMEALESAFPAVRVWKLDTPIWNTRTNSFYKKLGYTEKRRDKEFIYYEKHMAAETGAA